MAAKKSVAPQCNCGSPSRLVTGREVYPHRKDLFGKSFWMCMAEGCDGRVGCHPNTTVALGTLANAPLRAARSKTHAMVDQLWKTAETTYNDPPVDAKSVDNVRKTARRRVYAFLAAHMKIDPQEVHIGMFDEARCAQARRVVAGVTYQQIREWWHASIEKEIA